MKFNARDMTLHRFNWRVGISALLGVFLSVLMSSAHAQGAIRNVTVEDEGEHQVVKVETTRSMTTAPGVFLVQTPPRLVVDFPSTRNEAPSQRVHVARGALQSVSLAEAEGRTRVTLSLTRPLEHELSLRGNAVHITLKSSLAKGAVPATSKNDSPLFAEGTALRAPTTLVDVDFRRGEDGAGRVVVDLADAQTGIDIRPQGRSLLVEFHNTTLPEGLRRRLDVADFGTPVRMITASQAGDHARLIVEAVGDWEHSAFQSDKRFVLEVKPAKSKKGQEGVQAKYTGEKLSLNFQNIDVRALLQVIADFTKLNIITTDTVQGSLTLRLKDVPWDQALDIILESKQLGMTRVGNVIRIAPKKQLEEEALAQREVARKLEDLEPLRTEVFRLNFAKAEEVVNALKDSTSSGSGDNQVTNRLLSSRGSAIADVRTNQVFVTDVAARLRSVADYIRRVDSPKRQVLIQARLVEAREGFGRALGIRLGGADLRGVRGGDAGYSLGGGNRIAFGGSYDAITSTTTQTDNLMTNANTSFVNLPARANINSVDVPRFALSLFSPAANRFLNLEISALESDNNGRLISSPKVVTSDLNKAVIKQGDQLRFIQRRTNANGQTEDVVTTVDANLLLEVTPQITPSGNVLMKLRATKNQLVAITSAGPQLAVKEVETEVMVDNGGTVMIGGIFEQDERNSVDKVPLLGDVPVVGNLFKTRNNTNEKRELLIFVTPVIVDEGVVSN